MGSQIKTELSTLNDAVRNPGADERRIGENTNLRFRMTLKSRIMKKRTFLELSSSILAGIPFLKSFTNFSFQDKLKNWSGNLEYSTSNIHYPTSVEEVQSLVKKSDKVKALGSRHCFNDIADSKFALIGMEKMNKVISIDRSAGTVTVEGGMNYGQLCPYLETHGFALHNLASLPHISVAGACTTATHGSGVKNANLSTSVKALEFVGADGTVHTLTEKDNPGKFMGAVVGLGAIGIITKVTLALQPSFLMRQFVFEDLPLLELSANFTKIMSAGYSVSLFTDWQKNSVNEVWVKLRSDEKFDGRVEFFAARPATKNVHPIIGLSAENCTDQMGVPGVWYERLPHFKMGFTPSSGKELQAEYFVPARSAVDAIMAIQRMGKLIGPHLFISEIRTIAADKLWLSPAYNEDMVAIHFTWKQEWSAVSKLLPQIERELAPYNVKPHWGKLFTVPKSILSSRYSRMQDFAKLIKEYDPEGKFVNEYLKTNVL
jgi:alditol oxidase